MNKKEAIKLACNYYDYKWPKELFSGVMFYDGHKITIEEFTEWARMFNNCGIIEQTRQAMDEHMVKTSSAKRL